MTDEEKNLIKDFGALEYTDTALMASVLGWEAKEVRRQYAKKTSEFMKLYREGAAKWAYLQEKKLLDMALGGDLMALQKLEEIKLSRE